MWGTWHTRTGDPAEWRAVVRVGEVEAREQGKRQFRGFSIQPCHIPQHTLTFHRSSLLHCCSSQCILCPSAQDYTPTYFLHHDLLNNILAFIRCLPKICTKAKKCSGKTDHDLTILQCKPFLLSVTHLDSLSHCIKTQCRNLITNLT